MYSYLYSFIQKLILKKSLNSDAASLLKLLKVKNVIDIGCGDSDVLNYYKFDKSQKYYGYEANSYFINKLKNKFKEKHILFFKKNINDINFNKFNPKNSIILMIGVLHHLDDLSIKKFLSKTKKFKILSIDAVILQNQSFITKILYYLDRGNYIRYLNDYKKLLVNFKYKLIHNRYLRLPYDHVMFFKNIKKTDINNLIDSNK